MSKPEFKPRRLHRDFDRHGDGQPTLASGGWPCKCQWRSDLHGDYCPEHGRKGIPFDEEKSGG